MSIDGTNNNTLLPFSRLSRPSFQDSLFWPVQLSRSVGLKCPFPLDKNIVPSTVLLYPTYKINKQTRSGLGWVCTTGIYRFIGLVEFPKFQTWIFVEWKSLTVLTVFCFFFYSRLVISRDKTIYYSLRKETLIIFCPEQKFIFIIVERNCSDQEV